MTGYATILMLLVVDVVVGIFGGYAGYAVDGIVKAEHGDIGMESLTFIYDLATFQVDNVPYWLAAFFLVFNLLAVVVIVRTVRGID